MISSNCLKHDAKLRFIMIIDLVGKISIKNDSKLEANHRLDGKEWGYSRENWRLIMDHISWIKNGECVANIRESEKPSTVLAVDHVDTYPHQLL